jgi:hypothetical protein
VPVTVTIVGQGSYVIGIRRASQMSAGIAALTRAARDGGRRPLFDLEVARQLTAELDRRVAAIETTPLSVADTLTLTVLDRYLTAAESDDPALQALGHAVTSALDRRPHDSDRTRRSSGETRA